MADKSGETRPRAESAAARREARELHKELRQAADARRAASNRFSLSPAARKAVKEQKDDEEAGNQQDGNQQDVGDSDRDGAENEGDESDDDNQEHKAGPSALVTTASRRRQTESKDSHAGFDANLALDGHRHWLFTIRSLPLGTSAPDHPHLASELDERRAAGLFTRDTNVPYSSLVRMEQRLAREEECAQQKHAESGASSNTVNQREQEIESDGRSKLLQFLGGCTDALDDDSSSGTDDGPSPRASTRATTKDCEQLKPHPTPAPLDKTVPRSRRLAWLQLTVERVELDDHVRFTLVDRVQAQLRMLVAAYASHQRQRDWELPLHRIDEFVLHALDSASTSSTEATKALAASKWTREVRQDAERALQALYRLQLLHTEVLAKWDELRTLEANAIDHSTEGDSFGSRFALMVRKRATPIDLSNVQALLELLLVGSDKHEVSDVSNRTGEMNASLTASLRAALAVGAEGSLATIVELRRHSRAATGSGRLHLSRVALPPRVYVSIYVNGRFACRTRALAWDSFRDDSEDTSPLAMAGVVTFNEVFRLRLPHFPASVTAHVIEEQPLRSRLLVPMPWADESLSAHPVSIIVPGSDQVSPLIPKSSGTHGRHSGQHRKENAAAWIPAASVSASYEKYQFSAATDLPRTKWHRSLQDAPGLAATARRVQGRVAVSVAWIPSTSAGNSGAGAAASGGSIAYLPPAKTATVVKPSAFGSHEPVIPERCVRAKGWSTPQLIGPSCSGSREYGGTLGESEKTSAFARGRGFKRHVAPEELAVDANDPAEARVARLQRSIAADRAFSPLLSDVFRYFPDAAAPVDALPLTKRNQLLRLRDQERCLGGSARRGNGSQQQQQLLQLNASRAVLLHEPVPLLDDEILANEAYLRLLRPELRAFDRELLRERTRKPEASDRWSVRGRHELQRLALLEFLDRVEDAARRFAWDATPTSVANAPASSASSDRPLALACIIQEQPLPLFPGALELPALGDLFARRRKLRPRTLARRAAAPVTATTSSAHWPMHCELYIQVQRASNVPLKIKSRRAGVGGAPGPLTPRRLRRQKEAARRLTSADSDGNRDDATQADAAETSRDGATSRRDFESCVFVEVGFQGRTRRTTCCLVSASLSGANGATAEWMETLVLPFHAPEDDWDPVALANVRDSIRLRLYDRVVRTEVTEDAVLNRKAAVGTEEQTNLTASRLGKRAIHEEHCVLASLEVPFATLYRAQSLVDAPLRCVTPVEHLGYANVQQGERTNGGAFHSVFASSTTSLTAVDNQQRHNHDPDGEEGDDEAEDASDDDVSRIVRRCEKDATYLHVMMTLNPLLPPPPTPPTPSGSSASASTITGTRSPAMVLREAEQWASSLGLTPSVVACHLRLGPVLLTQLLGAQQPPPELASVPEVVHFVRCLPLVDDWRRAMRTDGDVDSSDSDQQLLEESAATGGATSAREKAGQRVWASSQAWLDLCAGDRNAHAVLLHNYLVWLDAQQHRDSSDTKEKETAFLVFGRSTTDREDAVLVLWKSPSTRRSDGVLWDATRGAAWHANSEHCPLRHVSFAVSSTNVFANVQRLEPGDRRHKERFNWDVGSNLKCWKPLFGIAGAIPLSCSTLLPCLQPRDLSYTATPPEYVSSVERELHEALKLSIRRWRSAHSTTVFNLSASLKVRAHLELLEKQQASGVDLASLANSSESKDKKMRGELAAQAKASMSFLLELQHTHDVAGVPVHVGFTDIPSVVRIVKDMGVHETTRPGVEFLLAVYACGYPSGVVSVWVYVASMAARA